MADSKGVWLDKDTGKVVTGKQPARARQLVAPGSDLPQDKVDAIVARYEANADGDAATSDDTEKTVTTKSTKK